MISSMRLKFKRLMELEALANLGCRKNIMGIFGSDKEVEDAWLRRHLEPGVIVHNAGYSWIKKSKENAILGELIYHTYKTMHPDNALLKKPVTAGQLLVTYRTIRSRTTNKSALSINRIFYLLRAISSQDVKISGKCRSCRATIVEDIQDLNLECALCRFVLPRIEDERKAPQKIRKIVSANA